LDTIYNFKEGEILVARTTSPDMIPAVKKAKAIVTEVGGLLCHAAIVAREFGIPCIIGTDMVTRILKDGDLVEVDAEKGIVRKLK
jgi:pyruvate,water dikinase